MKKISQISSTNDFLVHHVVCSKLNLAEIPIDLIVELDKIRGKQIFVDLSSNDLSILSCELVRLKSLITLNLTKNRIETIPRCLSHSSIERLILKENRIDFHRSESISSRNLVELDLSANNFSSIPARFFRNFHRLEILIVDFRREIFNSIESTFWLRSISTRNQLTLVLCDRHLQLSFCLFDELFREQRLKTLELNVELFCDCSLFNLPMEKIRFGRCSIDQNQQIGYCHEKNSVFERGRSINNVNRENYRSFCQDQLNICRNQTTTTTLTTTVDYASSFNKTTSIVQQNQSSTISTDKIKRDQFHLFTIVPLICLLLIVAIVTIYVFLSGRFFRLNKNKENFIDKKRTSNKNFRSTNKFQLISLFLNID